MHNSAECRTAARPPLAGIDFNQTPFVAIWEITRACDLACRHCRAEAIPRALPGELSTEEGFAVLDGLAAMETPICVLSGGDPATRTDLFDLIRHGKEAGMRMATIPAGTPRLTQDLVQGLKAAGLSQMALSLDGPTAEIHDNFRGVEGAFHFTIQGSRYASETGLPLQINTTFSAFNQQYFEEMAELVQKLGVVFWEVFFLVPMGRGRELGQMSADQFEQLFAKLANFSRTVKFIVKVTEAPHFRRYQMQQKPDGGGELGRPVVHSFNPSNGDTPRPAVAAELPQHMRRDFGLRGSIGLAAKGVNSGKGHLFISYCGDVCPSGFLPIPCGNVRRESLATVYRTHPVFRQLRDAALLKGKCGLCEYRDVCGGSRARAYAMTGDYLQEEPFCAYVPQTGTVCG